MVASGGGGPAVAEEYKFFCDALENPSFKDSIGFLHKHQSLDKGYLSTTDSRIVTVVSEVFFLIGFAEYVDRPILALHQSVDDYIKSPIKKECFFRDFEEGCMRVHTLGKQLLSATQTFNVPTQRFFSMVVHQLQKGHIQILDEYECALYSETETLRNTLLLPDTIIDADEIDCAFQISRVFEMGLMEDLIKRYEAFGTTDPEKIMLSDVSELTDQCTFILRCFRTIQEIEKTTHVPTFLDLLQDILGDHISSLDTLYSDLIVYDCEALVQIELIHTFYNTKRTFKNAVKKQLLDSLPLGTPLRDVLKDASFSDFRSAYYKVHKRGVSSETPFHILNPYGTGIKEVLEAEKRTSFSFSSTKGHDTYTHSLRTKRLLDALDIRCGIDIKIVACAFTQLIRHLPIGTEKEVCLLLEDFVASGPDQIRAKTKAAPDPKLYFAFFSKMLAEHFQNGVAYNTVVFPRYVGRMEDNGFLPSKLDHASLVYVDLVTKTLSYFDSSGDHQGDEEITSHTFIQALETLGDNEHVHEDVREAVSSPEEWTIVTPTASYMLGIPRQTSSKHCALFSFMYAHDMLLGRPFSFTEKTLDTRREQLISFVYESVVTEEEG